MSTVSVPLFLLASKAPSSPLVTTTKRELDKERKGLSTLFALVLEFDPFLKLFEGWNWKGLLK